MPLNRNTLMRIRTIDACLQRRHRKWTLEDLRQACEAALYDYEGIRGLSIRTVQRDIELMRSDKLGYFAPIVVKDRKYYTYEDPDFSITQLPLSQQDLAELRSAVDILRHYQGFQDMHGQEDVLTRMQDKVQSQDTRRQVVFIETNTQLKGLNFLGPLYDHIIAKDPIVVDYHSFKSRSKSRFHLSPYLLKEFNNRWFLIAHSPKMRDLQTLALDRMLKVEKDEKGVYRENDFFNPEEYLGAMVGVTRGLNSATTRVVLKVDADQAPYVLTKPLHPSQELVTRHDDGGITLAMQVVLNYELERLVLGFGSHIEVLSPRLLRRNIARHVLIAAAKYQPKLP